MLADHPVNPLPSGSFAVIRSASDLAPDDRLGEVGRAYLTVRADADLDEAQVIAFAKEHLANFKIPRSVVFVDEFPRNASGKILKRNLT